MSRVQAFDAVKAIYPDVWNVPGNVPAFDAILDRAGDNAGDARPVAPFSDLTEKICLELLEHEAIVQELYVDSVGVKTWGVGVTSYSGHDVERYRDNPQTIEKCLLIYVWLLRQRYLPGVLAAFKDYALAEHELGAALSFHYNTGQIAAADWVALVREGRRAEAYEAFLNYSKPKEIIPRRKLERDLFFNGKWTADGKVVVYPVAKPSYTPKWSAAQLVDVRAPLAAALAHP